MVADNPSPRRRSFLVLALASVSTAGLVGYAAARESGSQPSTLESAIESVTTVAPPTTTAAASTSTTSTTSSTTLPVPEPPPTDERAPEPVIELGTIEIPKIDVSMTMYEGIRLSTLDRGPGHWPGTAMPGQVGNVVVAGHRTSGHQVFRNIDVLVEGDEILFTETDGSVHRYRVTSSRIVVPTEVWIVDQTPTPTATLFACHPPGSVRERYVVFAELVA